MPACSAASTTMNKRNERKVLKTWSRAERDLPADGRAHHRRPRRPRHVPVFVTENMVGHRLGEFAPDPHYRGHGKATERSTALK